MDLPKILQNSHTIAIVGISQNPDKDSFQVGRYLQEHGYQIIPINPKIAEVLGEKAYPGLKDVPLPIDIVDVFRRAEAIPEIAEEALLVKPKVFWMQLGISHEEAARKLQEHGITVIQNRCIQIEHRRMLSV